MYYRSIQRTLLRSMSIAKRELSTEIEAITTSSLSSSKPNSVAASTTGSTPGPDDWKRPVKRSRASHRKPPKTNSDPTSPIGVLTTFEIPKMLKERKDYIKQKFEINKDILEISDVENPMRDIVNDLAIKLAFNNRIVSNVEILELSAKGDGIGIITAPTIEEIWKIQKETTERQLKEGMKEQGTQEIIDGKKQRIDRSKSIHRRQIEKDVLPLFQIVLVPFSLPGDIVTLKLNMTNQYFVDSEIMKIETKSSMRISEPSKCTYFGICSGCQYQSLSYEDQLEQKREVVRGAYEFFCSSDAHLESQWKGKILSTVGSPLQFNYRTKLTPHYDVPRSVSKKGTVELEQIPRLGYSMKGRGHWLGVEFARYNPFENYDKIEETFKFDKVPQLINQSMNELPLTHDLNEDEKKIVRNRSLRPYPGDVIDIEDCLIGTDIVRRGFINERERLEREWKEGKRSKKGVTILLREHSLRLNDEDHKDRIMGSIDPNTNEITKIEEDRDEKILKTCVTDPQSVISDLVDTGLGRTLRFDFIANEFFQNNNSILPLIIRYVRDELFEDMNTANHYLVDAYCGSGLFSVAIASSDGKIDGSIGVGGKKISKVLGVEISERAVKFAKRNAQLNNIPQDKCDFIWGKAEKLFEQIDFPKNETGVILDPPRKGCDAVFLRQLSEFEPRRIVYVSCNVHSQARDVKYFLENTVNGSKYKIKSIRGFDFFPQTHHVESVAVLVRD